MIESLLEVRGVKAAALVGPEGAIHAQVGEPTPDLTVLAAAKATISSLQKAMQVGSWNDLLVDLDDGPLLLTPVRDQILLTQFDDVASLGRIRFAVRRVLGRV